MPAHDELASALLECLRDVSSLLEHALTVAYQQQNALTRSDAEEITLACISQEDILRRIAQADERAASVAAKIAEAAGLGAAASTEAIAEAAGAPYTSHINRELDRVSALARSVRDAHDINSHLLRNGLEIITSCLRIVVREPEPVVYSKTASFAGSGSGVLTLDSRV